MDKAEYVVYPAALFDGWEVVKEGDDNPMVFDQREQAIACAEAQAARDGGAVVKLENWFGDVERIWEVAAPEPVQRQSVLAAG